MLLPQEVDGLPGSRWIGSCGCRGTDTVCEVISAYAKELVKNANPSHQPGCAKTKAKGGKTVFKPYFW